MVSRRRNRFFIEFEMAYECITSCFQQCMVREEYIQWNRPFSFMRTKYSLSHHSVLELTEIAVRDSMV